MFSEVEPNTYTIEETNLERNYDASNDGDEADPGRVIGNKIGVTLLPCEKKDTDDKFDNSNLMTATTVLSLERLWMVREIQSMTLQFSCNSSKAVR